MPSLTPFTDQFHHGSHARTRARDLPILGAVRPNRPSGESAWFLSADCSLSSSFVVVDRLTLAHRCRVQWLKNLFTADDVKDQIYKLARKGLTPSKIGAFLTSAIILSWLVFSAVCLWSWRSWSSWAILE